MSYFQDRKNVDIYNKMMVGYDNSFIINEVKAVLPIGATLLELGIGTGIDLISLSKFYQVIGSDNSHHFINDFKKKCNLDIIMLDAVTVEINKKFDCIYSNKVLQHLTKEDFIKSLINQSKHLNGNGLIFATLWVGDYKEEFEMDGQLRFVYYNENILRQIIPKELTIRKFIYYSEFEEKDSLLLVLQSK